MSELTTQFGFDIYIDDNKTKLRFSWYLSIEFLNVEPFIHALHIQSGIQAV